MRYLGALLVLATLAAQTPSPPSGADWPGWRGPNRDGLSRETGLLQQWPASGPPLAWKSSGLGAGFSSLSISSDRIFTMGDRAEDQYLIALSRTDGKELWRAKIGPAWDDEMPGPRGTQWHDDVRMEILRIAAGGWRQSHFLSRQLRQHPGGLEQEHRRTGLE